jgi:hypothetical protein
LPLSCGLRCRGRRSRGGPVFEYQYTAQDNTSIASYIPCQCVVVTGAGFFVVVVVQSTHWLVVVGFGVTFVVVQSVRKSAMFGIQ